MTLPRKRDRPRRREHPIRPPDEFVEVRDDAFPGRDTFRDRVLDATSPRGVCAGTPWCRTSGPHEGHHAHHVHLRSRGGSDHTTNGVWLCATAHHHVHAEPAEATRLGLMASSSLPWPERGNDGNGNGDANGG